MDQLTRSVVLIRTLVSVWENEVFEESPYSKA
jgi:hypothetical protein